MPNWALLAIAIVSITLSPWAVVTAWRVCFKTPIHKRKVAVKVSSPELAKIVQQVGGHRVEIQGYEWQSGKEKPDVTMEPNPALSPAEQVAYVEGALSQADPTHRQYYLARAKQVFPSL